MSTPETIASAGRSKNASRDGWEKTGRGCAVLVRDALPQTQLSSSINEPASPSRPGITLSTARSIGDGRSGATRSSASMAGTGPSPQRAPWQTGRQPGKAAPPAVNRPGATPTSGPEAAESLGSFAARYEISYGRVKL